MRMRRFIESWLKVSDLSGRPLAKMENNPYYGRVETAGGLFCFLMHQPRC